MGVVKGETARKRLRKKKQKTKWTGSTSPDHRPPASVPIPARSSRTLAAASAVPPPPTNPRLHPQPKSFANRASLLDLLRPSSRLPWPTTVRPGPPPPCIGSNASQLLSDVGRSFNRPPQRAADHASAPSSNLANATARPQTHGAARTHPGRGPPHGAPARLHRFQCPPAPPAGHLHRNAPPVATAASTRATTPHTHTVGWYP